MKRPLLVAAFMLSALSAHAADARRLVLRSWDDKPIATVVDLEEPHVTVAFQAPFGPVNVKLHAGGAGTNSIAVYFTQSNCLGDPYHGTGFSLIPWGFADTDLNKTVWGVNRSGATTSQSIQSVRGVNGACTNYAPFSQNVIAMEKVIQLGGFAVPYVVQSEPDERAFHPITPCRLFDTRQNAGQTTGSPLTNPGPHNFRLQGNCGVPDGASSVAVNLTVTGATTQGDLRLYPKLHTPAPGDPSAINFTAGQTIANAQMVTLSPVAAPGDKDVKILIGMPGSGSVHVILDVTGYFE